MLLRKSPDELFRFAWGKPRSTTSDGPAANAGHASTKQSE
jgi:hypothetical protein